MVVVGLRFGGGDSQRQNARGFDGNDVVLILQQAFDAEEFFAIDDEAVFFVEIRADDDVGDAGFVLEAQKDKTLGGAGTLAGNHATGHDGERAVGNAAQIAGAAHTASFESGAAIGKRMRAGGHSGSMKIGDETFFVGHRG